MDFIFKEKLDSTNKYAVSHFDEMADMSFLYCNNQTKGRGRLDRFWLSENPENLYLTIVLKPKSKDYPYINLTQYLCVVVCDILRDYGVLPQIKWPNDILVGGKKIAGILAQTSTYGQNVRGVALGIGVNLNSSKEEMAAIDKPATSLNLETGKKIDRDEFLKKLAFNFEKNYEEFVKGGFSFIKDEYIKHACFLDKEISVSINDKSLAGKVKNLTQDGALILCDNKTRKDLIISMGEIQC